MKAPRLTNGALGNSSQWNALHDDAQGSGTLLAHNCLGLFSLPFNPSNGQTITFTVNTTAITLTGKTGTLTTAGDFKIQGNLTLTLAVILNQLQNPWTTNATQIALSLANQQLLSYVGVAIMSTNIVAYSQNTTMNPQLTSFTGSTTFTSAAYGTNTMNLFIEPGVFYINGTQVKYSGGLSPIVTAPTSHPRIDLLTIDATGTVAWTTGTEATSPVPPAYPTYTKVPLCEITNVVGETQITDNANQVSGQGFVSLDARAFPAIVTDFTNISQDFLPDADNTRNLGSPSKGFNTIYAHNILSGGNAVAFSKFGGSGADGALSITSGTTTINCANAAAVVKNYTSISITGTGQLAFSNPNANGTVVILKSQGNVTITSSATPCVDLRGMGASTDHHGFGLMTGPRTHTVTNFGSGGSPTFGIITGGNGLNQSASINGKGLNVFCGAGGGSGNGAVGAEAGGAGGGGLYIECGGALNITGIINSSGSAGTNGGGSSSLTGFQYGGGGGGSNTDGGASSSQFVNSGATSSGSGGGGGAGSIFIVYKTLTANTGTYTVSGGAGGTGGFANGGAGGTGISVVAANTEIA